MNESIPDTPKVSIVMPAYKAEEYVGEAIDSVLKQSFSDWELIVVDDCSADKTADIAYQYAETDPRIRVIENDTNLGAAGTRNKGIAHSIGEWIAFLDCDDIWRNEKLEKQLKLAEETGAELIYTSYTLFSNEEGVCRHRDYLVPSSVTYQSMLRENYIGCSTAMVKKSLLETHSFSENIHHEDYALWLELLKCGVRSAGCREVLTDWRMTPESRSAHKISAARSRWIIFRDVEKLPLHTSIFCFSIYAVKGILKRYTGYKRVTGA